MHITFVAIGCEQLAISQLSAIAKQSGHTVDLAYTASLFNDHFNLSIPHLAPLFDDRNTVIEQIKEQKPDIVAFSALTSTYQWMLQIAKEVKDFSPDIITVFGGVHPSAVPERVISRPQVDYVIAGEGDIALPLILEQIESQSEKIIPNTRYKNKNGTVIRGPQTGFIQDLDSLPHYDKTIWEKYIRLNDRYMTMASRGCPYTCTFCFNNFFAKLPDKNQVKGKYVRQRSVEHVMHELVEAKKRYNYKVVEFQDDVLTVNKEWLKNLLKEYRKKINVPFYCLTHPKYMDEDIARWLSEAGCISIQMGIQTMDENYKYELVKRFEKSSHIEEALRIMHKYNLKVKTDMMFGLPNEPAEGQKAALELFKKYPPQRIQTFWTTFLPGTAMLKEAVHNKWISKDDEERLNEGLDFNFFRSSSNIIEKTQIHKFQSYEFIYRLIPILPKHLRKKLDPNSFRLIPPFGLKLTAALIDMFHGLITKDPSHISYAKHYKHHLLNFFRKKVNLPEIPATHVHSDSSKKTYLYKTKNQSIPAPQKRPASINYFF